MADMPVVPQDGTITQDQPKKISLKNKPQEDASKMEARWQNVEAIFGEAKAAYEQGSSFSDVMTSLITTLQNLAESESQEPMGGLGISGRSEMDLSQALQQRPGAPTQQ